MTISLLEDLKKIIVTPLRKTSLADITANTKAFCGKYDGSSDFLAKIRKETKHTKATIEPFYYPLFKELIKIFSIFQKETLPKALNEFNKLMETPNTAKLPSNSITCLTKIVALGIEAYCSIMSFLHLFVRNKQHKSNDVSTVCTIFKELHECFLNNVPFVLLVEAEEIFPYPKQRRYSLQKTIRKVYKKALKLFVRLKKVNQFCDQADFLLNLLEKAFIYLIDSNHHLHNSYGYDIFMYLLDLTDEPYHDSISNVLIKWHKKAPIHNIGRIYELLFLYGSENIKSKVLGEVPSLSIREILNFFGLFATKMYEGYLEDGLLPTENNVTFFTYKAIQNQLELSVAIKLKLQKIMTEMIGKTLTGVLEKIKSTEDPFQKGQEYEKLYDIFKMASVSKT